MSIATLILGESGTGKSTSLRNINPQDALLIKLVNKPLPFRSATWLPRNPQQQTGSVVICDDSNMIVRIIQGAAARGKSIVIIDDFQYLMSGELMKRVSETGFNKFTDIALHAYNVMKAASEADPNLRVYLLSHSEETSTGRTKVKTVGKMLDEKITPEGLFTIVLRTLVKEGAYLFRTQNDGFDTTKSPIGMFPTLEIENDLAQVDKAICEYYGLTQQVNKPIDTALQSIQTPHHKEVNV